MARMPSISVRRALQQMPHARPGPTPRRAQVAREAVGARIQLARSVSDRPPQSTSATASGVAAACSANDAVDGLRAAGRPAPDRAVGQQRPLVRRRHRQGGDGRGPDRRRRRRAARRSARPSARTVAASNRSVPYSSDDAQPRRRAPPAPSAGRTARVPCAVPSALHVQPAQARGAVGPCSAAANITWKSGCVAQAALGACSASTSRSNGTSWCAHAPSVVSRTRPSSARKSGRPTGPRAAPAC